MARHCVKFSLHLIRELEQFRFIFFIVPCAAADNRRRAAVGLYSKWSHFPSSIPRLAPFFCRTVSPLIRQLILLKNYIIYSRCSWRVSWYYYIAFIICLVGLLLSRFEVAIISPLTLLAPFHRRPRLVFNLPPNRNELNSTLPPSHSFWYSQIAMPIVRSFLHISIYLSI